MNVLGLHSKLLHYILKATVKLATQVVLGELRLHSDIHNGISIVTGEDFPFSHLKCCELRRHGMWLFIHREPWLWDRQ